MPVSGIYSIRNKTNNKRYIGSSVNISKRWNTHKRYLRKQMHDNIHLQSSWNSYGEENFIFEIIEENISEEYLIEKENFYLEFYEIGINGSNVFNSSKGYNTCWANKTGFVNPLKRKRGIEHHFYGKDPHNKGKKLSSLTKERISDNSARIRTFILSDILGNKITVKNLNKFCRENNYSTSSLAHFRCGKVKKWYNFISIEKVGE